MFSFDFQLIFGNAPSETSFFGIFLFFFFFFFFAPKVLAGPEGPLEASWGFLGAPGVSGV